MSEQGGDPCRRPIALRRRSQTLQSGGGAARDFFALLAVGSIRPTILSAANSP
jgi:hypothetical protein